jgi:hypothetical protein
MRYRLTPEDNPPTIGQTKAEGIAAVRVWCHTPGCARQDVMQIVPWETIKAPDTTLFINMRFRCAVCEQTRTTFMADWPVPKMGLGTNQEPGAYGGRVKEPDTALVPMPIPESAIGTESWERLTGAKDVRSTASWSDG